MKCSILYIKKNEVKKILHQILKKNYVFMFDQNQIILCKYIKKTIYFFCVFLSELFIKIFIQCELLL